MQKGTHDLSKDNIAALLSQYIYYFCMSGHLMGAAIPVISELPLLASVSGFESLSSFVAVVCSVSSAASYMRLADCTSFWWELRVILRKSVGSSPVHSWREPGPHMGASFLRDGIFNFPQTLYKEDAY